jgi:hypothetical protein
VTDFKRFSRIVHLKAFVPFTSSENALENINDVAEGSFRISCRLQCVCFLSGFFPCLPNFFYCDSVMLLFSSVLTGNFGRYFEPVP